MSTKSDPKTNGRVANTLNTNGTSSHLKLRIGIIGTGEVAQVIHLPTLKLLSHLFTVTALCDISPQSLAHCSQKFHVEKTYLEPRQLCLDENVDAVFILTSDEYHAEQAVLALDHNKHVFVEKPMALTHASADAIIEAEKRSRGRVIVGYMRRYASGFTAALQREIKSMDKIIYARCRDVIGPNAAFVSQSGAFPLKFNDIPEYASRDRAERAEALVREAIPSHIPITEELRQTYRILGSLGSHDLSLMREALGSPKGVAAVTLASNGKFWNILFNYEGFNASYELGIVEYPSFDAHLEIYSTKKSVLVQYDTPYVKGLPVYYKVREIVDNEFVERTIRTSYEDPYTIELKKVYDCFAMNKEIKTSAQDAAEDLNIFDMVMEGLSRKLHKS